MTNSYYYDAKKTITAHKYVLAKLPVDGFGYVMSLVVHETRSRATKRERESYVAIISCPIYARRRRGGGGWGKND